MQIPLLGIHNVRNAVAAIGVALTVGISIRTIKKGLLSFKGVQRRFNKIFLITILIIMMIMLIILQR